MGKIQDFLFKSKDGSIISLYRIIFGCFMVYQMLKYYRIDYTFGAMSGPEILFPYPYFEFLAPLPLPVLNVIQALLLVSAILITLGVFYRYAISFFFIGFTYFSFVDKTLYNNHLYLIALIAFVMIFMDADKKYSIRKFSKKKVSNGQIPAWNQYILMFLIALPYFFGGIAKLHSNWIHTDLPTILVKESKLNSLLSIFSEPQLVNFISYGGLVYDLGIVFLLLFKKTRYFGLALVIIFNLTNNSILFGDIGIFPLFMICSTILFFDSKKVGAFIDDKFGKKTTSKKPSKKKGAKKAQKSILKSRNLDTPDFSQAIPKKNNRIATALILVFVLVQIIVPFRYLLFHSNPEWYSVGSRFSWRMKMQTKKATVQKMYIKDRQSDQSTDIDFLSFLSSNQQLHLLDDPYQIVHLAKFISKQAEERISFVDPIVTAEIKVEFNGLPAQDMIDAEVDLTRVSESPFADNSWIVRLKAKD